MEKIDFATLRLAVPIDSVLAHYGVQTRKRNNNQLVANCPLPSHGESKHERDTFSINVERNIGYCHSDSCRAASNGEKGIDCIDVVRLIEGLKPLDAAKKLKALFAGGTSEPNGIEPKPTHPTSRENKPLTWKFEKLAYHPEIEKRGISEETAKSFGVGFHGGKGSMQNRIVFPLVEKGFIVGYAGRTILPVTTDNPKWKMPLGLFKTFLYGLERCDPAKPLLLVESPWAVLYFTQRNVQCAAMLGKELSDEQTVSLEPFERINLALDNDAKGKEATAKLIIKLSPKHKVKVAYLQG